MLSLKIDGATVELPPDFSITLNLKSPIFGETGSYSYPFKLPNTARNAIRTGFRHRISNTADIYHDFAGTYLWNGISFFSGTVKLKVLTSDYFDGYMLEGNGNFNYNRKNSFLEDCDYGELVFTGETLKMDFINACKGKVYPERDISFPQILNKTYFDELPNDPALLYFNFYLQDTMYYFTLLNNRSVIVPMLYVRYVLKIVFQHIGYTLDDTFFTSDVDFNSLVLYNSVDCNTDVTGFFQYDKLRLALNYHVPRMSMNDFFTALESFFNIRFFVNDATKTVKLISVDKIVKQTQYKEFSKQIISISTELGDQITGVRFTMGMDSDDEFYATKKIYEETFFKRLKGSVQSISDLKLWPRSDYFDIRWVFDEKIFYILDAPNRWIRMPDAFLIGLFSQYAYRNDNLKIETKCSTLMHQNTVPYNCVVGNAMTSWKDVTPKVFFTYYQDNGYANQKQVARNTTDSNSLYYGAENGLFNKHYKAYVDFIISTKLVKIVKQMEFSELKDFDFSKKYMIGGVKYLVKSIQVVLKKDRIMPATLECYICN